jgi:Tol biopolymer transport system component
VLRVAVPWLALVAGCGRVHFGPQGGADASATNDSIDSTDSPLGPCTQWGTFAAPVHLSELGSPGDDWSPSVTADELEVFFFTARSPTVGGFDVYTASRAAIGDMFATPVDVPEVSTTSFDAAPFISEDGLTLVVTSGVAGSFDLYLSARPDRATPFSAPSATLLGNVNSGNTEQDPWLSPDGLRLYFTSDRLTQGDFFVTTRASVTAGFGTPTHIAELGSSGRDFHLTLSHDELEAFFASDRGGNFDIYHSTRPDLATAFSTPVAVVELDSSGDDMNISLAAMGARVYYNFNAVAAGGNAEIWSATRACVAH